MKRAETQLKVVYLSLTEAVVNEALSDPQKPTAAIICYHPPLFRALKSITLANPLQACMLKCAMNGVSLYSPHTSVDAIKGGVNDWLVDVVSGGDKVGIKVEILQQVKSAEGEEGVGMGRKVTFSKPVELDEVVKRVKAGLGMKHGG